MIKTFELNVNGTVQTATADEDTPLLYILRNDFKLKGTRFGCGLGQCGSCTVLIDGRSVQSCDTALSAAAGKSIATIEGLARGERLHPLQQAFLDEQAGQCGYCLSGIIMAAAALLQAKPNASEADIRSGLDKHLCRCGAYERIVRAIRRAGQVLAKNPAW